MVKIHEDLVEVEDSVAVEEEMVTTQGQLAKFVSPFNPFSGVAAITNSMHPASKSLSQDQLESSFSSVESCNSIKELWHRRLEQNGRAERKHRHIVEMGLTLLAQANMPLRYCESNKGYKFLSSIGRIYVSRHVMFNESEFPFKTQFLHSKQFEEIITNPVTLWFILPNLSSTQSSPPNSPKNLSNSSRDILNLSSQATSPNLDVLNLQDTQEVESLSSLNQGASLPDHARADTQEVESSSSLNQGASLLDHALPVNSQVHETDAS
ncbi:hypothetical protein EZV62_019073 [Acer yangbiense]|uniref:Retroviral polymerase SH3-like domain-containing protein n=1 Tax=Acer yangbiense TaxID=1000413 RepID=A0A5C7HA88_9ROSI|nr:hypothetical protein EZV62_019073 [Acer yangbiense]